MANEKVAPQLQAVEDVEKLETLVSRMSALQLILDRMPSQGHPQDVAAAIGMLPDVEKMVRKIRAKWLAAIVANATQGALPIR